MVDTLDNRPGPRKRGLRYIGGSVGEWYVLQNHQGRIDGAIRHFRWTARQAYQRWPEVCARVPSFKAALDKADVYTMHDFLQFILPRTDYDPALIFSKQGQRWQSIYVSVPGYCILEEDGYRSFPLAYGRYSQAPEEWYGRGPTQQVLPELKTKNSEKEAFLKQGKLAGDPAYLLPEDGMFDFKNESGTFNYGGVNAKGQSLVKTLETGQIQITQELMADSDNNIKAAYLNDLFPLLFDTKTGQQRSAREVVEMGNQIGIFLSPLGRQFTEYCGPLIDRELDLASWLRLLPEMPPSVKEAEGDYQIEYTSPLGNAMSGQGIAGYMRSVEMANEIAKSSGDPSVFDHFDFDVSLPEIAHKQFSPTRWMASAEKVAQRRKARAAQQKQDDYIKSLPGLAAQEKAKAISAKAQAGQNIGGVLSGVPQGQMPMMPGQSAPGGSAFGQPGPQG
jgi:hypothetical protein